MFSLCLVKCCLFCLFEVSVLAHQYLPCVAVACEYAYKVYFSFGHYCARKVGVSARAHYEACAVIDRTVNRIAGLNVFFRCESALAVGLRECYSACYHQPAAVLFHRAPWSARRCAGLRRPPSAPGACRDRKTASRRNAAGDTGYAASPPAG